MKFEHLHRVAQKRSISTYITRSALRMTFSSKQYCHPLQQSLIQRQIASKIIYNSKLQHKVVSQVEAFGAFNRKKLWRNMKMQSWGNWRGQPKANVGCRPYKSPTSRTGRWTTPLCMKIRSSLQGCCRRCWQP